MQYRISNNEYFCKFIFCPTFILYALLPVTVSAQEQMIQQNTVRAVTVSNPWALPQEPVATPVEPPPPPAPARNRMGHFVTPDVLESLKQQQQQYQVMPENRRYNTWRQYAPAYRSPGLSGSGRNGYPLYGTGMTDPLYDVPIVSPWGNDGSLLYRGGSLPMVPDEAIGGLPPIYTPSMGMKKNTRNEQGDTEYNDDYRVFNPFTFLPQ